MTPFVTKSEHPPIFFISSDFGCIGRFWWSNTIQRPNAWICGPWPFPLWGTVHWYNGDS